MEVTKSITIDIPTAEALGEEGILESDYTDEEGNVSLNLVLKKGGETVFSAENLNFSSAAPTANLKGIGVVEYELFVNGHAFSVITVVFGA